MKVKLWCSTHDMGSSVEEIIDMPDNSTTKNLDQEAEQFFWNEKEPCWGFEIIKETKWQKYDGEYEKTHYDIKLKSGIIYDQCWPNAGNFFPYDYKGIEILGDQVKFIKISTKHPLDN